MRRFRITRNGWTLEEGVVWRDGRATTHASRLWENAESVVDWWDRDVGGGVALVWIDSAHEDRHGQASLNGTVVGSYPKANEGTGKLPSERFDELGVAEFWTGDPDQRGGLPFFKKIILRLLDERLGRAP